MFDLCSASQHIRHRLSVDLEQIEGSSGKVDYICVLTYPYNLYTIIVYANTNPKYCFAQGFS